MLPQGEGPFPVVVQMHGCGGKKKFQTTWGEVARKAGAAVIIVDSHAPRRISELQAYATVCTGLRLWGRERAGDLYAALAWARKQSWADPNRLAAAGWSHGGWTVLDALALRPGAPAARATKLDGLPAEPLSGLRGAFLVYPYVGRASLRTPHWNAAPEVVAILGGRDHIVNTRAAHAALQGNKANGASVEIHMFDTATHAFDEPDSYHPLTRYDAALVARAHHLYADFVRAL